MTLTNHHSRTLRFALILFILLVLPFQTAVLGKKRHENNSRRGAARAGKGKKLSARERRAARRDDRRSARDSRHGGKSRLSRRELREQNGREEAASLKAVGRK